MRSRRLGLVMTKVVRLICYLAIIGDRVFLQEVNAAHIVIVVELLARLTIVLALLLLRHLDLAADLALTDRGVQDR